MNLSKNVFFIYEIKPVLIMLSKKKIYSNLKFRGRSENGLEAKTLKKNHNSATGGRRRLRFCMKKLIIKVFWHANFDKNRRWSLKQLAEIDLYTNTLMTPKMTKKKFF